MNETTNAATEAPATSDEQAAAKAAVEAGRVCCAAGRTEYCVCRNRVICPRHFPRGVCVGSHD